MRDYQESALSLDYSSSAFWERYKKCERDRLFYRGVQWDLEYDEDTRRLIGNSFDNKPKPVFNKVFSAVNRIIGDLQGLEMNAVISPQSELATRKDANFLNDRYRFDFNNSRGIRALNNLLEEGLTGGFSALKIVAKYEDEENPDHNKQYLCIEPIQDATSCVYFNVGAIEKDRSDATQCWQLFKVNKEVASAEFDRDIQSSIYASGNFDGTELREQEVILANYWEVVEKRYTLWKFMGEDGTVVIEVKEEDKKYTDPDTLEEIPEEDFLMYKDIHPKNEKLRLKRKAVMFTVMDGDGYLQEPYELCKFGRIPVIPFFCYHQVVNGNEEFWGETRQLRHVQIVSNMNVAAMMKVLTSNQVERREYLSSQLTEDQQMRMADADADDADIVFSEPADVQGQTIVGPVSVTPPAQVSPGVVALQQYTEASLQEIAGTGQTTLPSNVASGAVRQINERRDSSYMGITQSLVETLRTLCKCWISAAQELYFTSPRNLQTRTPGGDLVMTQTMDENSYDKVPIKAQGKYDVEVKAEQSHDSKRQVEIEAYKSILQMNQGTPIGEMASNRLAELIAPAGAAIKDVARYQDLMIMMNYGHPIEPRNEKEAIWLQNKQQEMAQQSQEESADMVYAQAEQQKAMADMKDAENQENANLIKREENQMDSINKAQANDIKMQELYLKSLKVPSEIAKNIGQADRAESKGSEYKLDNVEKVEGIMDNYE